VRDATRAVFQILSRHVNFGQVEKVRDAMPEEVRNLWPLSSEAPDIRERAEGYGAPGSNAAGRSGRRANR
jgi:hypothetical protein